MSSYANRLGLLPNTPETTNEIWMLGRHEGLFTPFVDWTKSPYVAAFFAAATAVENRFDKSEGFFAIHCISQWIFPWELENRSQDNSELPRHALLIDASKRGNQRAIAQKGLATYIYPQTDLLTYFNEFPNADDSILPDYIIIRIPFKAAKDALMHLYTMNIDYSILYPDRFGLALQANLNLYVNLEGLGNWSKAPGFEGLIPAER